jgi:hypothetical protein
MFNVVITGNRIQITYHLAEWGANYPLGSRIKSSIDRLNMPGVDDLMSYLLSWKRPVSQHYDDLMWSLPEYVLPTHLSKKTLFYFAVA